VLAATRAAFVIGMQLGSAIAAGIGLAVAALALAALRHQQPAAHERDAEEASTATTHDGPEDSRGR
jgi:ABC-type nickel/cobalt efflux system permease component RcnA